MFRFKRRLKLSAPVILLTGALVMSGFIATPALADDDTPPSGFPSWQDVQNAKQSAASTATEVAKINGLLNQLQTDSVTLGDAAVSASSAYLTAKSNLDAATSKEEMLSSQLQQADEMAQKLRKEAGSLAAQSYKTGSGNLGIFSALGAMQSSDGLQRLDLINVVAQNAANWYSRADAAKKSTESLQAQQKLAQDERSKLNDAAKSKYDAAVAAQKAVEDQVSSTKSQSDKLNAQLASLNNTVADTEQKYQQGVAAQAQYEEAQQAKQRAAEEEAARQAALRPPPPPPGSGGQVTPPPLTPPVTPPNIPGGGLNDPAGAQAFASANLSGFGWGQDQFGCLLQLWNRESGWRTNATNPSSGAYGIPQSLPASKMGSIAGDWLTNYQTQVIWGLNYIKGRYGSPCGAWAHSQATGWY